MVLDSLKVLVVVRCRISGAEKNNENRPFRPRAQTENSLI